MTVEFKLNKVEELPARMMDSIAKPIVDEFAKMNIKYAKVELKNAETYKIVSAIKNWLKNHKIKSISVCSRNKQVYLTRL